MKCFLKDIGVFLLSIIATLLMIYTVVMWFGIMAWTFGIGVEWGITIAFGDDFPTGILEYYPLAWAILIITTALNWAPGMARGRRTMHFIRNS